MLDDRVAELGLRAARASRSRRVERVGRGSALGRGVGSVGRVGLGARARRQPTTIGSRCVARQRSDGFSFWMRSCSITMPWMNASGRGGQPGHVHVDRDDLVDALRDRVRVPVGAAAVRARAHRDDVLRVGHLLVEALDRGRHLVGDRARDHDEVGLARARRERDHAEAHHVVAGAGERGAHLDRAAREAPLEHPQRVLAAVVEEPGERLGRFAGADQAHLRSPLRQTYASPSSRTSDEHEHLDQAEPAQARRPRSPTGKMNTASTSKITNSSA